VSTTPTSGWVFSTGFGSLTQTQNSKIEVMGRYLARQAATGRAGVAAIGVAQEFAPVFSGTKKTGPGGAVWFAFTKADRRVTCYYLALLTYPWVFVG
jgi:hypothetical protein